jgi:hypothetical protein
MQIYGCYINTLDELNKLNTMKHNITHLTIGERFNMPIDKTNLPSTITHLTFCWNFNQPVDNLHDFLI